MNIQDALRQIAADGGLNADELIAYAAEDHIGGRDTGHWPGMSTFEAEGQILYALIRAMRPAQIVEIGIDSGGTSTHILSALAANDYGQLYSVDVKAEVGAAVPAQLRDRWTICIGDALTAPIPTAEFIFEDGPHTYDWTLAMFNRIKAMGPRVMLTHDMYSHRAYGPDFAVERAFGDCFGETKGILTDGSIAGLGYWWNADWHGEPDFDDDVVSVREVRKAAK